MSVVSNAPVVPDRQGMYVKMLHELLRAHSVSFGKVANFAQLIPKLVRSDQFRVEFSMLVQWFQRQEDRQLTLNQMLAILWIAMTGSQVDGLRNANTAPLMIFLSGLGGWHETEAERVTFLEGRQNASESGVSFTSVGRKEEERQARAAADRAAAAAGHRRLMVVALWLLPVLPLLVLCVALYRDHMAPPAAMPSEAAAGAAPAAAPTAHDVWIYARKDRSSRVGAPRQPGVEDRAETPAPKPGEQENAPWPVSGFAVLGDHGQLTFFDQTAGVTLATEPAKIHTPKPEPPPTIAGGATMPTVMPEAVVTMSYPRIVAQEAPRSEPDRSQASVAEPERARTGLAAPESGRAGVPSAESKGAGSRTGMPVVVASSTEASVPTVARTESRPTPPKAVSSGKQKPFDLVRPRVAVNAGLLSADIVKFQMPSYPKSARKQGLQGDVLVRVLISEKGKIVRAVALNGPQSFREAAEKAVSHWRYVPYVENGQPVAVQTWVTFHFELRAS